MMQRKKAWHQGRGHQALAQPGHSQPSFINFFHYSELWNILYWPSDLYILPGEVLSHSRFLYRSVLGRGLLLEEEKRILEEVSAEENDK